MQQYCPTFGSANQQVVMYNVTSPQFTANQRCFNAVNYCDNRKLQGEVWTPALLPNNNVMEVSPDEMTDEQTASWIHTIAQSKGWAEAWQYSQIFLSNNIVGHQLKYLNMDSLKSDLGIQKYAHRLRLIEAIQCLFPCMEKHAEGENTKMMGTANHSPMSVIMPETEISPRQSPELSGSSISPDKQNAKLSSSQVTESIGYSDESVSSSAIQAREVLK